MHAERSSTAPVGLLVSLLSVVLSRFCLEYRIPLGKTSHYGRDFVPQLHFQQHLSFYTSATRGVTGGITCALNYVDTVHDA